MAKLARTGFLAVSEGIPENKAAAGGEEVAAVALAQCLRRRHRADGGGGVAAKLVDLAGHVRWDARWEDPSRRQWHETKMRSKVTRAAAQLAALALPHRTPPLVWHVALPPPPPSAPVPPAAAAAIPATASVASER